MIEISSGLPHKSLANFGNLWKSLEILGNVWQRLCDLWTSFGECSEIFRK